MSTLAVGIVGLPNTGKTTLFNALSRSGALVTAYPGASIEPNVRDVPVADHRLAELTRLEKSARTVPATVKFTDIAGLAAGASKGEGLGNRFLAAIRQVDAVVQVVRGFELGGVPADPAHDLELFETELLLSDLEIMGRELERSRQAKKGARGSEERIAALEKIEEALSSQTIGDRAAVAAELAELAPEMGLLTLKPTLLVLNISGPGEEAERYERELREWADPRGVPVLAVNAQVEAELAELEPEEAEMFAAEMGIEEGSLDRITRASFDLLGLITFFTTGPDESKAWPIRKGLNAREAAGKIHSDIERGFIKAEVVKLDQLFAHGTFAAAGKAGAMKLEGRDYIVADGDVIIFKFNV